MYKYAIPTLILLLSIPYLTGCEWFEDPEPDDESAYSYYILSEGSFGSAGASLWGLSEDLSVLDGPLVWDLNEDPLGDVGQSLYIHDDRLYIVLNGSHRIEVLDLDEEGPQSAMSIDLPGASPRYMAFLGDLAFVSCWNLNAILTLDLNNGTVRDSIFVGGLPEDVVLVGSELYTSITMDSQWRTANRVLKISESIEAETWMVTDTFFVSPGPGRMLVQGDELYIASTYYDDSWQAYAGTSTIYLGEGEGQAEASYGQTSLYGGDLGIINSEVYRSYDDGIAPLDEDLQIDTSRAIPGYPGIYGFDVIGDRILVGTTDYGDNPDSLIILDLLGNRLAAFPVGEYPGAFAGMNIQD